MNYYGIENSNFFEANYVKLSQSEMQEKGYIEMSGPRPTPEHFCSVSDGVGSWVIKTISFDEELQEINAAHDIKVDALVNEYNRAMTFDGSSETEKVEAIRAELNAAKSQYEIDVEQLAIKHYG